MARYEGNSVRLDFRIPNDLLEQVREIAVSEFNAPIHHISKKPETTPTLIQLIQYGIKYLESGLLDSNTDTVTDRLSANLPDSYLDTILNQVSSRLSVNNPDINTDNLVSQEEFNTALTHLEEQLVKK